MFKKVLKKKILILGSTGLLGTSLEKVFKKSKNYIFIGCSHSDLDITNRKKLEKILNKHKPHLVINTVALIGIKFCEENPKKTIDVNGLSVFNLSILCKKLNITLVQISTHAVFDGKKPKPYVENDKPNPLNIYGYSKLMGEYFVKSNLDKYFILRMPTMYGPRRNKSLGFVDKMIKNMQTNSDIKVASDRIDSPSYALNIASKIKQIIKTQKYGTYHISDNGYVSYYDFIKEISKVIKFKGKVKKAKDNDFPSVAPNPLRVALSSKKGSTGVHWKKAVRKFLNNENLKC